MKKVNLLESHHQKLNSRYLQLIEQAYNLRKTDHALSDDSEFKALKLLHKLNKIKFLFRDNPKTTL
ncbi:Lacal_2735 family protein [uncultured Lacinutrix sp.]|uniref:Lacal_2735 family protein n=1 Tax=uncultured Lacinutrix sp. TaxID=574032 RepID=UPI00261A4B76|nr:Lacal_2735 family protein [uncultured Lacinutrix sp.]